MAALLLLLGATVAAAEGDQLVSFNVQTGQVFSLFLSPHLFNWSQPAGDVTYRPSASGRADLPSWLRHRPLPARRGALLYGRPPRQGLTRLQVVATDRATFRTALLTVHIRVTEGPGHAAEVKLKIDNLNIEDVFDERRMERLKELFTKSKTGLWPESRASLHLAFADSVPELGGRRPLQPQLKDGVVVRLASTANFSAMLLSLDRETQPLRRLASCSYKRSSVERFFRQAGFAVDWCAFRLLAPGPAAPAPETGEGAPARAFVFTARGEGERRARVEELLTASVLPLIIFLVFSGALGGLLWADCGEEKQPGGMFIESLFDVFDDCCVYKDTRLLLAQSSPARPDPALPPASRASSVARQADTLRSLGRRRDVTPRLQASPPPPLQGECSSLSRSRTASPGPRQSLDWELLESLSRPQPPAYGSLPRVRQAS